MDPNGSLNAMFGGATDDGTIGQDTMAAMGAVDDLGALIQAGLGMPADNMVATEVVLVSLLVDDTGSIAGSGNTDAVIEGHNGVIKALKESKQASSILFYSRFLNKGIHFAYSTLDQAVLLDRSNYVPSGVTPLYDQSIILLSTVLAKAQEFALNGVPCRTVTLIVTDGDDNNSKASVRQVKPIVRDLLAAETHIVGGMGIGNTTHEIDRFRAIFQEMGIHDQWILTPKSDPHSIRTAFAVFSQSAVRASQGATHFGSTAVGGFGSP